MGASTGRDAITRVRRTRIRANWELYLFVAPAVIYFVIFHYGPMYGVQIAFKDFVAARGILGSEWVGFEHFRRFFNSFRFWELLSNTIVLSLYQLVAGFPIPIIFALFLNQIPGGRFRRTVQTVSYAPHFISVVVVVGMLHVFLSPRAGVVNHIIDFFGGERILFMGRAGWFRHIYVWSGVWQRTGWAAVIYLAALANVPPELHEAAIVDGANKLQRIRFVDLPTIMPTAVILLILNFGQVMQVGFQKAFLMQSPLNLETSEIIATYVYKVGLLSAQFSFSAAVGLFNALINLVLVVALNALAKRLGETSLW